MSDEAPTFIHVSLRWQLRHALLSAGEGEDDTLEW